jgi:hypothetical protein
MIGTVLFVLTAAAAGPANSPLLSPSDFAAYMQPKLPMRISPGLVTTITAEGTVLVWHVQIDNAALALDKLSNERIGSVLAEGWCSKPEGKAFFRAGYSLRWDLDWKEYPTRRIVVHNCG